MLGTFSACALAGLVALGGWERLLRDRARRAIPVRIHVNGTRGKSTVTRMIAAALRASGRTAVAKTTGTAARIILPDGSERDVRRRSLPSIREQLWFLREAHRLGADAVVVECMAIDPALQFVSEHHMLAATIGVITNARPDHADVMGTTPAEMATALANTVPSDGVLVLGDVERPDIFATEATRRRTRIARPVTAALDPGTPAWVAENVGLALAVTREVGIPDEVALPAILAAPPDPGALRCHQVRVAEASFDIIDASAANDTDSLATLLAGVPDEGRLFVFNHRGDRPTRLAQFSTSALLTRDRARVVLTGDRPDWMTSRRVSARLGARIEFVPAASLVQSIGTGIGGAAVTTVIFCGNAKGLDVPAFVAALART